MELTATQDVEAPQQALFRAMMDFDRIEAQLAGSRIDLHRQHGPAADAPLGTRWVARFRLRGEDRRATVTLCELVAPDRVVLDGAMGGLEARSAVTLDPLDTARTRVTAAVMLHPGTLSARLMLQSLRLARGTIEARFRARSAQVFEAFGAAAREAGA